MKKRSILKRRPGVLVQFRLPEVLVSFIDGWAVAEHTTRSALLVKLVSMAKAGADLAVSEPASPLFKMLEGQVEVFVERAVEDQRQRDKAAAIVLGGVVSSRRRAVRK